MYTHKDRAKTIDCVWCVYVSCSIPLLLDSPLYTVGLLHQEPSVGHRHTRRDSQVVCKSISSFRCLCPLRAFPFTSRLHTSRLAVSAREYRQRIGTMMEVLQKSFLFGGEKERKQTQLLDEQKKKVENGSSPRIQGFWWMPHFQADEAVWVVFREEDRSTRYYSPFCMCSFFLIRNTTMAKSLED